MPSFDGTPLDVDVTLPEDAERGEPLPTIVMLHGYGGNKRDFEAESPEGDADDSETTYHYNNVHFAQQGYAVLNYTARGFGRSCGRTERSNMTPDCLANKSYIHLADQRWEGRDSQHLLGRLVDQGITDRHAIGTTGISYGGGQSIELAYLRDRIRKLDGSFKRWRSPEGKRLEISAAYPRWPWSDLVYSLLPNGRFLDFRTAPKSQSLDPLGVPIQSYISGLFALGGVTGTYCGAPPRTPPCNDPSADLTSAFAEVVKGEPISARARAFARELVRFHSGFPIPKNGTEPAPLLLQSGWTDDLFPPSETIRVYNDLRTDDPDAPVSLQFGDLGHARASNKENSDRAFNDQGVAFFDRYLQASGARKAPEPGRVTAYTQTCPQDAPADGPFKAKRYSSLDRGALEFARSSSQTVSSGGGNPATSTAVDPIAGGRDACREVDDENEPGTAVVRGPVSRGFTLLGLPTITANVDTNGNFGQLDSRLWDVAPNGKQRLISRSGYRLENDQEGRITFQQHGNGYCFASGHRPKLQLLGRDAPYYRPSNTPFSIEVSDVDIELPTAEKDPVPALRLSVDPDEARSGRRTRFTFTVRSRDDECARKDSVQPDPSVRVEGVKVRFDGIVGETDENGRFSVTRRVSDATKARAAKSGYQRDTEAVEVDAAGPGSPFGGDRFRRR